MSKHPVHDFPDTAHTCQQNNKTDRVCSFLCCSKGSRRMDVFSMIKHSIISDEVNPITRYYDIRQHVASCGPEMVWKIYDAVRLEDNKVRYNNYFCNFIIAFIIINIIIIIFIVIITIGAVIVTIIKCK